MFKSHLFSEIERLKLLILNKLYILYIRWKCGRY